MLRKIFPHAMLLVSLVGCQTSRCGQCGNECVSCAEYNWSKVGNSCQSNHRSYSDRAPVVKSYPISNAHNEPVKNIEPRQESFRIPVDSPPPPKFDTPVPPSSLENKKADVKESNKPQLLIEE